MSIEVKSATPRETHELFRARLDPRDSKLVTHDSIFETQLSRLLTGLPLRGAQPSRAQRLQNPQRLLNAPANVHVAHHKVAHFSGRIDDESCPQAHSFLFFQDSVGTTHPLLLIAKKRIVHAAQLLYPGAMRFQRIDADPQDFRLLDTKLSCHLAESCHFRGTDKGKIRRVKKEDQPTAVQNNLSFYISSS